MDETWEEMDVKESFHRASELMEGGEFGTALSFLSHVLQSIETGGDDDQDLVIAVLSTRAYCHTMIGRLSSAESDFNRVITDSSAGDPIIAPTLVARAVLFRILCQEDAAAEDIASAISLGIEDAADEAVALWDEWKRVPAISAILDEQPLAWKPEPTAAEEAVAAAKALTEAAQAAADREFLVAEHTSELEDQNTQLAIEKRHFEIAIEEQAYRLAELEANSFILQEQVAAKDEETMQDQRDLEEQQQAANSGGLEGPSGPLGLSIP
jgi:hypothetical protein